MIEQLLCTNINRLPPVPGPSSLAAGTTSLGYYGQVAAADFVSSVDLASRLNMSVGTPIANSETWLKFAYKGKTLFISKQCVRNFISPQQLDDNNLTLGNRTITINGRSYYIRVIRGGSTTPGTGSEWNDLIYRVSVNDPTSTFWAKFTDAELRIGTTAGCTTWCMETPMVNRVYRGYNGLTPWATGALGSSTTTTGWRPVLELM